MRLAVIRNDMPAPFLIADLEQVSRRNDPVDAEGQEQYLSLPTAAQVTTALGDPTTGVGATITATGAPTSLTISGSNDTLRLKTSSAASFSVYVIAHATYGSAALLVAAINTALAGSGIHAFLAGAAVSFESQTHGVNSYIQNDTTGNGSTANTNLNIGNGVTRTMPPASAFLTAAGIPGGPLNVSQATLQAVGSSTATNALKPFYDAGDSRKLVVANAIAPIMGETEVVLDSFLLGNLSQYRNASYNPDRRLKSVTAGAAISVVADDGSTAFSSAHTLPTISSATLSGGNVTISGTGLGNENGGGTLGHGVIVKFTGTGAVRLEQKAIIHAGGSVLATAIIVPASLIPGVATTTTHVQVQVRQRLSNSVALS